MIDRYTKFYEQRSASRDRTTAGAKALANPGKPAPLQNKAPPAKVKQTNQGKQQRQDMSESLGLRDPLQLLEQDINAAAQAGNTNTKKQMGAATVLENAKANPDALKLVEQISTRSDQKILNKFSDHDLSNPQFIQQKRSITE